MSNQIRKTDAICPHFGQCGGCLHQDLDYESQLHLKEQTLKDLFQDVWTRPIPVTPSPALRNYRNKVDFTFAPKHYPEPPPKGFVRDTVLGFKEKGRWYAPLHIDACHIGPEGNEELLKAVRTWMNKNNLRAFDSRTKEGLLKILLFREGKRTGEKMVVIITGPGPFDGDSFVEAVREAFNPTSVYRGIHKGSAPVADAEETELLYGEPAIHEELRIPDGDSDRLLRFRISPFAFFQTNTLATERLYGHIRDWVKKIRPEKLYDLYGGSGGIALTCADLINEIESADIVESAAEDGRYNASANSVDNITFHSGKMKNYLLGLLQQGGMEPGSAAIVDPPRAGMTPKASRRLIECRPKDILYVSCNPKILSRELPSFLETYRLADLRAVDLFPHTDHVEAVAWLTTEN